MNKVVINLKKPMPPSDDCLPHAAMTLGSIRGVGTRPTAALVSRLVIQESMGQWYLYRMDDRGGFVGDTSHATKEDALRTAKKEFALSDEDVTNPS